MRVLHLNARLKEGGGAAILVLDLHQRLLKNGIESGFCYGYGRNAGRSPDEDDVPHVFRGAGRASILPNFFLHRVLGADLFPPTGSFRRRLISAIGAADIVHLHVLHSYYMPFTWLLPLLIQMKKKVVWTAHDSWLLTGRCAITDGCEGWQSGCGVCPTGQNFPPSFFDLSRAQFARKRKLVNQLGANLRIVAPSQHLANDLERAYPELTINTISNGISDGIETAVKKCGALGGCSDQNQTTQVLVIAHDLSYAAKTDPEMVRALASSGNCQIHTVGNNSPFDMPNVVNHGVISSQEELVKLYSSMDVLLFTSTVDAFGLVMVESLLCGTPVIAVDSPGSREILAKIGAVPIGSGPEIIKCVQERSWQRSYPQKNRNELHEVALSTFSGDEMCRRYIQVYRDLSECSNEPTSPGVTQ